MQFENEIAILEFQLGSFEKIVADLPATGIYEASPGHGHSPAWILGHLAIVGEKGLMLVGGDVTHRDWANMFGPGTDGVGSVGGPGRDELIDAVRMAYRDLIEMAREANPERLAKPNPVALFEGTLIKTVGNLVASMMTNHFAFHLAQLSSCRRMLGFEKLF